MIGAPCYVYNLKVTPGQKFCPRSEHQYIIGYTTTGYCTYDPVTRKISDQCNLVIHEKIVQIFLTKLKS